MATQIQGSDAKRWHGIAWPVEKPGKLAKTGVPVNILAHQSHATKPHATTSNQVVKSRWCLEGLAGAALKPGESTISQQPFEKRVQ
jgi:hypothetical protein